MPTSPSRRTFLKQSAAAAAGLTVLPHLAFPAGEKAGDAAARRRGLLCEPRDIQRMRETIKLPRFAAYWKTLRDANLEADAAFLQNELQLNNHAHHMLRARLILERTAFVHALTNDARQLELARLAIDKLLQYKRWDYFLEAGEHTIGLQRAPEATIAMVSTLELLGPALPADLRKEMEAQIADKGAPACYRTLYGMKYPERVRGWGFDPEDVYPYRFDLRRWPLILNSTNLKVIPIAGLMMAGCRLYGRHPQAERWIDMALQSARAFSTMYGPDGSYDEGVGYWGYTSVHLALALEVLYRRTGADHRNMINFPGTAKYALAMTAPTIGRPQDCINFGDAWTMGDIAIAAWTAGTHRDGLAQYVAENIGEVHSHYAILWYDPRIKSKAPAAALQNVRLSNDLVIGRTGWQERSSVAALRSGGPANHEHADRNSVIFSAYGERLLHDPYKAAYSYTDPHWLLRLTQAHTAVLIDGKGHQYHDGHEGTNASWAEAHVESFEDRKGDLLATSDATEAYRLVLPGTQLVRRSVIFLKPDILVLVDRIRLKDNPLAVQLRFQVDNFDQKGSATADGTGFRISRPNATLVANVYGSAGITTRAATLPVPVENGVHPFVEVQSPEALEHTLVTVCTAQQAGKEHGTLIVKKNGPVFEISGRHNTRTVRMRISTQQDLPEIDL